jgi:hypothetical protein
MVWEEEQTVVPLLANAFFTEVGIANFFLSPLIANPLIFF